MLRNVFKYVVDLIQDLFLDWLAHPVTIGVGILLFTLLIIEVVLQ